MPKNRLAAVCTTAMLALTFGACARSKPLVGGPGQVSGSGVTFTVKKARTKKNRLDVYLVARNDTAQPVMVNRNMISVVLPNGRELRRSGGRQSHTIAPNGGTHGVNVETVGDGSVDLRTVKDVWVRFDGVCINDMQVQVPPLPIGNPTHQPGSASVGGCAGFAPSTDVAYAPGTSTTATGGGMQRYNGPRAKLQKPNQKCAAIPLAMPEGSAVANEVAFVMDEVLLSELQASGFEAIGPDDINAMLGFEKVKDAVGCDDAGCIAELGNALGVEYLVAGKVAGVEESMVLTLKIIDVQETRVLARANRIADGGQATLPRLIGEAVQELVQRSGL
jgi:hypothetical protein